MRNIIVSIITPVYNSSLFIEQNISSVKKQSLTNYEHILIDDCSTDDSVDIIESHSQNDHRIKLIKLTKNRGAGVARNMGIKASSGRFIAFLDSDDYWDKYKLEKQVNFMLKLDCPFSYTQYYVVNNDRINYLIKSPVKVTYKDILKNCYIGCLTAMYDTHKIGKIYMPKNRKRQDWVLWINILKTVKTAYGLQEPLAYYRVGNKSLSNNKFKLLKHNFNVYHQDLSFSKIESVFRLIIFLFHYFEFKLFFKKRL